MRVACVLVTHLRAKVELRRQPHLRARPAVVVDRSKGKPLIVDCLPAASGVTAGMTLEQALSRHAETVVIEADEPSYRRAFGEALDALQSASDRVEASEEFGVAYASLDGLEALHGGEERLVRALLDAVPRDLEPRVGVGDAKFPAFAAAMTADPRCAAWVPADAATFLGPLSIDLLPLSPDARAGMRRFGIRTMGDVASMGRDLLAAQFGSEGASAWELSHGVDDSPLVPMGHEEPVVEHVSLPFASASLDVLAAAVDTLLRRAYSRPGMQGREAGGALLECALHRAAPWEQAFHFKGGAGDWERVSFIVRRRLEADRLPAPVEELTLTLTDLSGEQGTQMALLRDVRGDRERRLEEVERQFKARTGGGHALYRAAVVAPWHPAPEMRALQAPIGASGRDGMRPFSVPVPVEVREGPDEAPAAVRLGGRWCRVTGVEEQWSFDLWWMPEPLSRTYYRVRREDGGEVTLFRDRRSARWYRQEP